MEGQLMDRWTNAFAKEFYAQHKAEQKRKAALLKKIKIAVAPADAPADAPHDAEAPEVVTAIAATAGRQRSDHHVREKQSFHAWVKF